MITTILLSLGACFGYTMGDGSNLYFCYSRNVATPIIITITVEPYVAPPPQPVVLDRRYLAVQP